MLLVVDVQHGFVSESTEHALPNVKRCVHAFDTVVATRFVTGSSTQFRELVGWEGIDDSEILPFVANGATERVEKSTYSAVNSDWTQSADDEPIYIAGFETDACVLATAFDLFDAGRHPIVVRDACGTSSSGRAHEDALSILRRNIGSEQVVKTETIT